LRGGARCSRKPPRQAPRPQQGRRQTIEISSARSEISARKPWSPTAAAWCRGLGNHAEIADGLEGSEVHLFAIACDFLPEFSRSPPGVRHALAHLAQPSNCFRQKRLGHTLIGAPAR